MKKRWALLSLSIAVAAVMLLAAGLSSLELAPGQPFPVGLLSGSPGGGVGTAGPGIAPPSLIELLGGALFLGFVLLLLAWLLTFLLKPEARGRMLHRLIAYIIWAALLYAIMNAMQQAEFFQQPNQLSGGAGLETPTAGEELPAPPTFVAEPPRWFIIAATISLIGLGLALPWLFWLRRRPPAPEPPPDPRRLVAREAGQAIEAIHSGSDLTDTIIRSYRQMNRVLSQQRGVERSKTMTPREFENHLDAIGLQSEHIWRLTRLFESVRYGANTPDREAEQEAVACLQAIVEAYGRPR